MQFRIRAIEREEWHLLEDFLYEAIYVPEGFDGEVPRSVIFEDQKCPSIARWASPATVTSSNSSCRFRSRFVAFL